jgi:hypothetical protein
VKHDEGVIVLHHVPFFFCIHTKGIANRYTLGSLIPEKLSNIDQMINMALHFINLLPNPFIHNYVSIFFIPRSVLFKRVTQHYLQHQPVFNVEIIEHL